jgi:hypothetical protein
MNLHAEGVAGFMRPPDRAAVRGQGDSIALGAETEATGTRLSEILLASGLFLITAITVFSPFRYPHGFLAFYVDDFFYYLKVAQSIATTHLSTFDGTTLTNGYHPLWMATLVLLLTIFKGKGFFLALAGLTTLAVMIAFHLSRAICSNYGVSSFGSSLISFLVCLWALKLMSVGMEATLAIPLILGVVLYVSRAGFHWSPRQSFVYGLLASLAILSRLDAILFVLVLLVTQILFEWRVGNGGLRRWLLRGFFFSAGGVLLPLYVVSNIVYFHTVMPVSGSAKQLKEGLWPSIAPLSVPLRSLTSAGLYNGWFIMLPLLLSLLGFALLIRQAVWGGPGVAPATVASLCFPLVHLGLLSVLSDWQVLLWYFYPIAFSSVFAMILFYGLFPRIEGALKPWPLTGGVGVLVLLLTARAAYATVRHPPRSSSTYQTAIDVAAFAENHPGKYAMGDRAGFVSYLLPYPLVQLEGLVMDEMFLEKIRERQDLITVLQAYGVKYYIATNPRRLGPCYEFVEPSAAGPASPKMRGELCRGPLMALTHQGFEADIFDVSAGDEGARAPSRP